MPRWTTKVSLGASKVKVFGTYNKAKKRVAFKGDRNTNPAYNNRVECLITKMFW